LRPGGGSRVPCARSARGRRVAAAQGTPARAHSPRRLSLGFLLCRRGAAQNPHPLCNAGQLPLRPGLGLGPVNPVVAPASRALLLCTRAPSHTRPRLKQGSHSFRPGMGAQGRRLAGMGARREIANAAHWANPQTRHSQQGYTAARVCSSRLSVKPPIVAHAGRPVLATTGVGGARGRCQWPDLLSPNPMANAAMPLMPAPPVMQRLSWLLSTTRGAPPGAAAQLPSQRFPRLPHHQEAHHIKVRHIPSAEDASIA
jgi:hypothetical protein